MPAKYADLDFQDRVEEYILAYTFSDKANLLGTKALRYDKSTKQLVLLGFIPEDYLTRDKEGTCLKLTKLAFDALSSEFEGEKRFIPVEGYEPKFFQRKNGSTHYFLVTEHEGTKYVVDPSFGVVTPLNGSGYETVSENVPFSDLNSRDLVLQDGDVIPIYTNDDGKLVSLVTEIDPDRLILTLISARPGLEGPLTYLFASGIDFSTRKAYSTTPVSELEKKIGELVENSNRARIARRVVTASF